MDRLCIYFILLLGVITGHKVHIYGSVLEKRVSLGDNITLYCDCKTSTGVYIVWYRNCSHENQPPLTLSFSRRTNQGYGKIARLFTRFHFVHNESSKSYNLVIVNFTKSDEGLYYCGTEEVNVVDGEKIVQKYNYTYGNDTTRIIVNSSCEASPPNKPCDSCWMLLFTLCPALTVLSCLFSTLLVYHLCKKTAKEPQVDQRRSETRGHTRENQDDDVCYAALEIRQASQRPTKKRAQTSEDCTYSDINTCRM